MNKPVNILFFLEDLCYGGTQKQILELAQRLDRKKFAPRFLVLTGRTDMDQKAIDAGIPVYYIGSKRKVPPLFFLQQASIIRKLNPDILVPCTALPNIWGRIWGRLLKIPAVIGTIRGGGAPFRQHERILWRLSTHLVCNSKDIYNHMLSLGADKSKISCIPNGIDTSCYFPAKKQKNNGLIICVARLVEDKDHITLIKAFEILIKKFPYAKLRLVGEGPLEPFLRKYTDERAEIKNKIEFAGASSNPASHYLQGTVFALSSQKESMPNSIMEAMSCGLPVCAANTGGIPELVQNGQTGFLSSVHNAEELADNLLTILQNPENAHQMGINGRKYIEDNFSMEKMVNKYEILFERLWKENAK